MTTRHDLSTSQVNDSGLFSGRRLHPFGVNGYVFGTGEAITSRGTELLDDGVSAPRPFSVGSFIWHQLIYAAQRSRLFA